MKRKDFLRNMRNRRRRDELELREPERRRIYDWRTLRVDLPEEGEAGPHELPVGSVRLLPDGIVLEASEYCWVRGYRVWRTEDGQARAEFQYRPVREPRTPPPGAIAVSADTTWKPEVD